MTIKVYRVESRTGRRVPLGASVLVPKRDAERVPESLAYPPCACARCAGQEGR
ncbi:hypothetical protein [Streptomyces sp. NPDC004726]